ncbi:MAG: hypothetical protein ACK5PR_00870 [bacterium]
MLPAPDAGDDGEGKGQRAGCEEDYKGYEEDVAGRMVARVAVTYHGNENGQQAEDKEAREEELGEEVS